MKRLYTIRIDFRIYGSTCSMAAQDFYERSKWIPGVNLHSHLTSEQDRPTVELLPYSWPDLKLISFFKNVVAV